MTIKYGKGYEETWAVFNGQTQEVRQDILDYFGIGSVSVANLTLSELVVNVTNLAHGKGNVAALMGGVVLGSQPTEATANVPAQRTSDEAQQPTSDDGWGDEPAAPAGNPLQPLYDAVEACADKDALKRLWAENQVAFADADLLAAWKAKGKALS